MDNSGHNRTLLELRQDLRRERLLPNITAGLVVGILEVSLAISFAALIFSGNLSRFAAAGVGLVLFSTMTLTSISALLSSRPGNLSITQDGAAVILALAAAAIASAMPATASDDELLLTILAALAVTTLCSGLFFLALGTFRLGDLIRFVPYPVIGGFLAGTGWLFVQGSIAVMADLSLTFANLPSLLQPELLIRWLPGLAFAILLVFFLSRFDHFLTMPGLVAAAFAAFYLALWVSGTSIAEASAQGFLMGPFPQGNLWRPLGLADLGQVNWRVIWTQAGSMATVLVINTIGLLLNASSIELAVKQDIDLNRELQASGVANLVTGIGAGIPGYVSTSTTILAHRIGIEGRLLGLVVAAISGLVLMLGVSLLSLIPKIVLGGLLLFLGLDFLIQWFFRAWSDFSRVDFLIISTILVVIAFIGFLQGVMLGIALAVVLFVINYSRVNVVKHALSGTVYPSRVTRPRQHRQILTQRGDEIYILQLQGFIFFGTANSLLNQVQERIMAADLPPVRYVLLDFHEVTGLDSTTLLSFAKMKQLAQQEGFQLLFTNPDLEHALPGQKSHVAEFFAQLVGTRPMQTGIGVHLFPDLDRGLEWCEDQILLAAGVDLAELPESLSDQLRPLLPNDDILERLLTYLERLEVDAGDYLMKQGDPADAMYLIESGQVTAQLERPEHQPVRLESMGGGRVVGEIGFFLDTPRTAAVVSDGPGVVYRLTREALTRMQANDPAAAFAFHQGIIRLVSERLTHLISTVNALQR